MTLLIFSVARLVTLLISPLIPCSPLRGIIADRVAILPFLRHLVSQRINYIKQVEMAIHDGLSTGPFSQPGTLPDLCRP